MKHRILKRNQIFSGRAFDVEELQVSLPDGRERHYDLVDHNDSVSIIPIADNGDILFVEQFRIGGEERLLELPAGIMDEGEDPETCAAREVREETGMAAGGLARLGAVYLAPGYCNELNHIFLAEELTANPLEQDDDEFLSLKPVSIQEAERLIANGGIKDSKTLAALYLFRLYQEKR